MQSQATSNDSAAQHGGRYRLLGVLARGGQGDVWRARDLEADQEVALKLLNDGAAHNADCIERLRRERAALVALQGTCAVRVLDGPPHYNGAPCMAMELLDGVDLETRLGQLEAKGTRLCFVEVTQVLEPLVQTLHRAHGLGIVHRDLKPANIFLLKDGAVRLIDFGFARLEFEARMTAFGVVMGSPCYIAPEVWQGHANTSGVSVDIYSLAAMAFRMLAGCPPFETKSLVEMRELATRAPRPSLHRLRPDLSGSIDRWVHQALAIDPHARYPTIRSMWEALCEVVHQPKPNSWSIIPRAVAESLHPKRVAEALRRAGAVLWGRTSGSDRASTPQQKPVPNLAPGSLGFPKPARIKPPKPVRQPESVPESVIPLSVEAISEAIPLSSGPLSAGPRSSKHTLLLSAHNNTSQNIAERNKRRKKRRRRKASKQTRKSRQAQRKTRARRR
jgi:serine/threonine-protein kinase